MKDSITCKQAVDYISKKEEGKLSAWQRVKLWRHLAGCSLCHRFSIQNKMIIKLLSGHQYLPQHQLSQEDKQQIVDAILGDDNKIS
jgi:hypothetical protein